MKSLKLLAFLCLGMAFFACKPEPAPIVSSDFKINGFAQKGPFTIGTKLIVSELSTALIETGRNFNGTITDDRGSFTVEGSGLTSNFVAVSADGFYFDEVSGQLSASRLILNAIVDLSKGNTLNINVLTHLEFERVKYLMKNGQDFSKAKEQAKTEVLSIFKINSPTANFEKLDISKTEDEHAALLAISAILQGSHTVAQLSELLSKISLDIKEDGKLDTESLKAELLGQAGLLNTPRVRTNIAKRFQDIGVQATIGNFEKYVEQFIKATGLIIPNQINYPKIGPNGYLNLLAISAPDTTVSLGNNYCFAGFLPDGASLKVIVRAPGQSITWVSSILGSERGFSTTPPTGEGTRTWLNTNSTPYCWMTISAEVVFQIEIYENGAATPKRVINVKGTSLPFFSFDDMGKYGKNMAPQLGNTYPYTKGAYSLQVNLNDTKEHTVKYEFYYFDRQAMLFSNPEGWTVTTDTSSANITKTALTYKATKGSADMKITLAGSSNATAQVWIDGVVSEGLYKKMAW
jgi:hypothetical protein